MTCQLAGIMFSISSVLSSIFLAAILLLYPPFLNAQDNDGTTSKNQPSQNSSIDAMFGLQYLRKDTLDTYMDREAKSKFGRYSRIIGVSFAKSFEADGSKGSDVFFTCQYQVPNVVHGIDSIDYTLTGYQLGICVGGKDVFHANKEFDVVYGLGVQFGGYYLKRELLVFPYTVAKTKNGVIAPQLVIEARYFIGDLKLGFKMRGQYDISNTNWKQLDTSPLVFGGFSATGFAFQAMIGYRLN